MEAGPSHRRSFSALALRAGGPALFALWLAAALAAAGTPCWGSPWLYAGFVVGGLALHRRYVARRNAPVLKKREAIGEGTKGWDLAWVTVHWLLFVLVPLVAGLDVVRWGKRPLGLLALPAGAALVAAGLSVSAWAMAANPFFEGTVRVAPGQHVVEAGPYRFVRHPGYLGLALWSLGTPLFLRSRWALASAALSAAWVVVRTVLEDRVLRRELGGYAAYAARVRHRLVPGLW